MKNPILLLATFMVLITTMTTLSLDLEQEMLGTGGSNPSSSLGGNGLFLGLRRRSMRCNKYPKVCRNPGSPGRDCCKKRCVNVRKDKANCGKCGHKCKYSEICCKGRCVKPASDRKNCGCCGNKCKKGTSCVYGFCSYA